MAFAKQGAGIITSSNVRMRHGKSQSLALVKSTKPPACLSCRHSKIKCDRKSPSCTACLKNGRTCEDTIKAVLNTTPVVIPRFDDEAPLNPQPDEDPREGPPSLQSSAQPLLQQTGIRQLTPIKQASFWPNGIDDDIFPPHPDACCEQCGRKRWPLWATWAAVLSTTSAAISLYILSFATASAIDFEHSPPYCPSPKPQVRDFNFLFALQNCGWQFSNMLAGLIPACIHAHRFRKWGRMSYAWLPVGMCLGTVMASVVVYGRSPAVSQGLAGLSNLPLGFFIFFATYESLREEKGGREGERGGGERNGFVMQAMGNERALRNSRDE